MKKILFLLLIRFLGFSQASEPYNFENLSQENGLSQGTGYAITQYDNFLWFATQDGLNRYDGYDFKVYRAGKKHALNDNFVQTLLTDSKGRLWVGTKGGLNVYNNLQDNFALCSTIFRQNTLLDSVSIEKLIEDKKGNIWIMTDEKGIFCFNPTTKKVNSYFLNNNTFFDFTLLKDGKLCVSSYSEVYFFDVKNQQFQPLNLKQKLHLKPTALIQAIVGDTEGRLWVSIYQSGVYRLNLSSERNEIQVFKKGLSSQNISDDEVRTMMVDKTGKVWLGTKEGGLSLYNPKEKTFMHIRKKEGNDRSLAEDFILSIYEDKQGIVWLGTGSSGISKYDPLKFPFQTIRHEKSNIKNTMVDDMVFCVYGDADGLYFGTNKGGLSYYSYKNERFTNYLNSPRMPNSIIHDEVYNISASNDNQLWIVTTAGICVFDKHKKNFKSYIPNRQSKPYYEYAILSTSFGEVWTGGERGLGILNVKTEKWKTILANESLFSIEKYVIRLLKEDSKNNIWLGTIGHGLVRYDPISKKIQEFNAKNGLKCSNIRSLLEDEQTLWIGTDCGLFALDLVSFKITKYFSSVSKNELFRLPNDVVYGILKDDYQTLWLSTNQGLVQFSPKKGVIRKFDLKDGLQSNEFNTNCAFKRADGTLFFGGVKGVNFFHPSRLTKNTFVPPLKLTKIKVMDSLYNPNQRQLELKYDQNFIEFEFTSLNLSNSQKNQYKYQLVGVDKTWVNAGNKRFANYTKLSPGEYIFLFKASNSDDIWNETPASIAINIVPPLWGYWWFWPLVWLLGFSVLGLGYYLYVSYDLRNKLKVQHIRNQIASDLHDDIGGTLTSISYFGEIAKKRLSDHASTQEIELVLDKIINNSQEMIESMRGVVWAIKPENDKAEDFFDKMNAFAREILDARNIEYDFEDNQTLSRITLSVEQRRNLFLFIKESIHNIAKHSKASKAQIRIMVEKGFFDLKISDNGIGFDTQSKQTGNGLKTLAERARQLNGTIEMVSSPTLGTKIQLRFSIK
jgi:ligand-binding sensor domain-containing protein/two-component sensor histidine kinase